MSDLTKLKDDVENLKNSQMGCFDAFMIALVLIALVAVFVDVVNNVTERLDSIEEKLGIEVAE